MKTFIQITEKDIDSVTIELKEAKNGYYKIGDREKTELRNRLILVINDGVVFLHDAIYVHKSTLSDTLIVPVRTLDITFKL